MENGYIAERSDRSADLDVSRCRVYTYFFGARHVAAKVQGISRWFRTAFFEGRHLSRCQIAKSAKWNVGKGQKFERISQVSRQIFRLVIS